MGIGKSIMDDIIQFAEEAAAIVSEEMGYGDAGVLTYMNGEDGTEFDWTINGRLCNFCMAYNDTDKLKIVVYGNDTMEAYFCRDDEEEYIAVSELDKGSAAYMASLLLQEADDKNLYDTNVFSINLEAGVDKMLDTKRKTMYQEEDGEEEKLENIAEAKHIYGMDGENFGYNED